MKIPEILKKVSFITTVYNEEKDIRLFLDSLINQTYLPEEVIIVDGGSTDGTLKIIRDFFENISIHIKDLINIKSIQN